MNCLTLVYQTTHDASTSLDIISLGYLHIFQLNIQFVLDEPLILFYILRFKPFHNKLAYFSLMLVSPASKNLLDMIKVLGQMYNTTTQLKTFFPNNI